MVIHKISDAVVELRDVFGVWGFFVLGAIIGTGRFFIKIFNPTHVIN